MSENGQEKREALADIVREKRSMAAEIRANLSNVPVRRDDQLLEADSLDREADRIEAAWKRERAEALVFWTKKCRETITEHDRYCSPVGNVAAMREALVKIRRELNDYCNGCTLPDRMAEDPPDYTCLRDSLLEIERIVADALSAPARNCDLKECSTVDGMIAAHERFCKSWHEDGNYCSECPFNTKSKQMTTCREMWLLAPAAERKGKGE